MNKPNIPNPELEESVAEPKDEIFKSRLEIEEPDLEKIAGGSKVNYCSIVV